MALKPVVDNLDDVDEAFRSEYKEHKDAKTQKVSYVLDFDGSVDVHPAARTLKDELARRRITERDATEKLKKYAALGDRPVEEILAELDELPTLREAANGKVDDKKIDAMVETRVKQKVAPIERERDTLKTKVTELEGEVTGFRTEKKTRSISDAVRAAVGKSKGFQQTAVEDAIVLGERVLEIDDSGNVVTKDGVGVTPGVSAEVWLTEIQDKRPHWWGETSGGGAGGNRGRSGAGGVNPWTHENWNMTEQGKIYNTDRKKAEDMAKSAGTTVGGKRPAPKK